ncbi:MULTISPECIES: arylsulfatase [unclassified Synechococcus]|uniref:arylsulfatase n=1 Tax=unclassified Synechococcus TaxID=2626047 RepID=UPI001E394AEF|nr:MULTISPECIES: arylsulfatase [unclassified Synechococcus]
MSKLIRHLAVGSGLLLLSSLSTSCTDQKQALGGNLDRTNLPIAEPKPEKVTKALPSEVPLPPQFEVTAPKDAPNVVIILLDDVGFAAPSAFGGAVNMPTAEKLADNGLRYNKFHTTALCAPTRAALKSGRNHHKVNMGSIPEIATGYAGNSTVVPDYAQPVAEILRLNGYNTGAFGKWHETPGRETTAAGPQTRWPTRQGFEKFYGFVGAEDNMWDPTIHDGVTVVDAPKKEGYHFTADMTDQAIGWMRQQKSIKPDKPFFIYYSSAGSHSPHHVSKEWIAKYKGKFDEGWDVLRKRNLQNQIKAGIVPEGTQMAKAPDSIPKWDSLTPQQQKIYARQAEVFAAFTEYSDYEAGRLIQAIDDLGELDNTLVIYITGDNGASPEGDRTGQWNWNHYLNGVAETPDEQEAKLEEWGGPTTYPMYHMGWAIAFNSPFALSKQVAGDFGGTRNGTVIHWPKRIQQGGGLRTQFSHVNDVAPTILEAANLPMPKTINGVTQIPMQGTSLMYTFDAPDAKEKHDTQYFEIIGNRGIYHNGWMARTTVMYPWMAPERMNPVADDSGWQLYDTTKDFSLSNDLADQEPERLIAMKKKFMEEAIANQVLPLDDRLLERLVPSVAGRPTLLGDRTSMDLYPYAWNMVEDSILNVKNTSSSITAQLDVKPGQKESGVIFSQGGRFGGWSLYVENNVPAYTYNYMGKLYTFTSNEPLPVGQSELRFEIDYDGGGVGKGADVRMKINDKVVALGRLDQTIASRFSIDEGADVGLDRGSAVTVKNIGPQRYSAYGGQIDKVTLEIYPKETDAKKS